MQQIPRLTPSASFIAETMKVGAERPSVKNEEARIRCASLIVTDIVTTPTSAYER